MYSICIQYLLCPTKQIFTLHLFLMILMFLVTKNKMNWRIVAFCGRTEYFEVVCCYELFPLGVTIV